MFTGKYGNMNFRTKIAFSSLSHQRPLSRGKLGPARSISSILLGLQDSIDAASCSSRSSEEEIVLSSRLLLSLFFLVKRNWNTKSAGRFKTEAVLIILFLHQRTWLHSFAQPQGCIPFVFVLPESISTLSWEQRFKISLLRVVDFPLILKSSLKSPGVFSLGSCRGIRLVFCLSGWLMIVLSPSSLVQHCVFHVHLYHDLETFINR